MGRYVHGESGAAVRTSWASVAFDGGFSSALIAHLLFTFAFFVELQMAAYNLHICILHILHIPQPTRVRLTYPVRNGRRAGLTPLNGYSHIVTTLTWLMPVIKYVYIYGLVPHVSNKWPRPHLYLCMITVYTLRHDNSVSSKILLMKQKRPARDHRDCWNQNPK